MSFQPKLRPKGFPHTIDDFAVASLSELEHRSRTGEDKRDQRVFRVKRNHVLKACDRCRVKKTKCDGKQPCNRCSVYNHPCLFRERKATQTKVYSRGFVEMLESHHSLVVKALQKLYKFCINKEGFPGEPLAEAPDGHPLTHAILDRLGLIKQAEENADDADEDSEDLRYLRMLSTSTECSATAEPSPEPSTPPEPWPTTIFRSSICASSMPTPVMSRDNSRWQWDMQALQQPSYSYPESSYQDMMSVPRSSIAAADLGPTEIQGHVDLPARSSMSHGHGHGHGHSHGHVHDPSFAYYLNGHCNSVDGQTDPKSVARMHTNLMPDTHSHQMGHLSNDMLTDFRFTPHELPVYADFTPGWNFPSI